MNFPTHFQRGVRSWIFGALIALGTTATGSAADLEAVRFTDRTTGEIQKLDTWAGEIVVLDFFAYWCAPCRPASEKIEQELARHYIENGHPLGTEVTVLAVNVESARPARTEKFIESVGLSHVVDDEKGAVLDLLGARGLPFLVVLDGTRAEADGSGWKIAYRHNGLESIAKLREVVNGIGPQTGGQG